jgi:spermidine synthase
LFSEFDAENQNWRIGAVGLGAGALACYHKDGQNWRFYEIDPLVVQLAQDSKWFHYLERCNPKAEMVIGDARLSLIQEADNSFDLLIMDAFSSDAVPTHLLTREAMQLYFSKLKADGMLAFHITNRHLALKKVLADHLETLQLSGLLQEFKPENEVPLVVATDWVVISKQPERLERLRQSRIGHWQKLPLTFGLQPWTDDFTHIIGIWK